MVLYGGVCPPIFLANRKDTVAPAGTTLCPKNRFSLKRAGKGNGELLVMKLPSFWGRCPPRKLCSGTGALCSIFIALALCCSSADSEDWRAISDGLAVSAHASSLLDGGQPDLADLTFVFYEDNGDIDGVAASVHQGDAQYTLGDVGFYRRGEELFVRVKAQKGQNFRPHFYFVTPVGDVVEEYRANVFVREDLTYYDQEFGTDEQFPYSE